MAGPLLVRFEHPDLGMRLGLLFDERVHDMTPDMTTLGAWLQGTVGDVPASLASLVRRAADAPSYTVGPDPFAAPQVHGLRWLAPVDDQDVWAAGVTYLRSREARQEEAVDGGDIYARVYRAERPELFLKAYGRRVVGPGGWVGIREDSAWSVPEPELALVLNQGLEVVGMTIGNDLSSRDIEGANPLYLPQAKFYTASCALGPGILLGALEEWPSAAIRMTVERAGEPVFRGEVSTTQIHRRLPELLEYLGRSNAFPEGVVLLTGTGIVPPAEFTLGAGDVVRIEVEGIGALVNTVKVV